MNSEYTHLLFSNIFYSDFWMSSVVQAMFSFALRAVRASVTRLAYGWVGRIYHGLTNLPRHRQLPELRVLFHGKHFLVIDKDFDVIINHDDPERPSVAMQLKISFPQYYDEEISVRFTALFKQTKTMCLSIVWLQVCSSFGLFHLRCVSHSFDKRGRKSCISSISKT